jgi:hypothetical protein
VKIGIFHFLVCAAAVTAFVAVGLRGMEVDNSIPGWPVRAPPGHTPAADAKDERAQDFFTRCGELGFTPAQCRFFRPGSAAK